MLPTAVPTHTFMYVYYNIKRFFLKITTYPLNYVFYNNMRKGKYIFIIR